MKRATLAALLLVLPGCDNQGPAGPPYLVKEFEDDYPRQLVDVEGTLFFLASDRLHGSEVWRSNGTPDGTRMVKDVTPGPEPPGGYRGSCRGCLTEPASLTRVGRRLFFIANDGRHGWEPWVSDGSDAGTRMIQDVTPGDGSSLFGSHIFVELQGAALFTAHEPVLGRELWSSDGTESGTFLLADIAPGPAPSQVLGFVRHAPSGLDYFTAQDGTGWALWRTDGTSGGTAAVARLPAEAKVAEAAKRVLLTLDDQEHGHELWRSDGTPEGTMLVHDIAPGLASASPYGLARDGHDERAEVR
jgi:ELWxxDGT repeat protein